MQPRCATILVGAALTRALHQMQYGAGMLLAQQLNRHCRGVQLLLYG
jgi:hypothetical protein